LELFGFVFFQRALIGGLLIGFMAPLIGVFIVLRRLSLIGDTLAHVTIAGVALGFLINIYPFTLGVIFALLGALAIEYLRKAYRSYAELSLAIIMSGGIGLASVLFTWGRGFNMNVHGYLFGSILTLNNFDIYMIAGITCIVAAVIFTYLKELFVVTFDEDAASVAGLPLRFLNLLVTLLTALVISAAIKIVGALLVSALLTIPVACSLALARSFRQTIWISIIVSEIALLGGLVGAGFLNLAPGGSVVMFLIALLILSLVSKKILKI